LPSVIVGAFGTAGAASIALRWTGEPGQGAPHEIAVKLVALNVSDIEETPEGIKVAIRRSKTDQEGAGQIIAVPYGKIACP
jgi:hypothetical protein